MEIKPVLSVLIATMPKRSWDLNLLLISLTSQLKDIDLPKEDCEPDLYGNGNPYNPPVEFVIDGSMEYNIGIKRNHLLSRAKGDYIVFVDDDDKISPDYLRKICNATLANCDSIGISGTITTNGGNHRQWHISRAFGSWYERNGIYYRTPNHISPVKRELALRAGFPEISFGEDAEYSNRLLPLIKSEIVIQGNLYHYDYHTK